jgi:hypothetical protein
MSEPMRVIVATILALSTTAWIQDDAVAQGLPRLFPPRDHMPRLLAAPREPVTGAKFVWNNESPNEYGAGIDGEVALGASLPLYLIAGETIRDGLSVGAEAAVFARFTLKNITKDLITTDWVFAFPFTLHRGGNWYQLRYHHLSGHLGDEYIARFEAEAENFGRDAVDVTAFRQAAPTVGFYGGVNWAFNVHPKGARRFTVRVGAQVEARNGDGALIPYGGVDAQWEQDNEWEPRMNLQLGVRLPELGGRRVVRVAVEFFAGPSAQGQFHEEHVRHLTLGIYIDP